MNTRSKTLLTPIATLAILTTAFLGTLSAKVVQKSPHGFNAPQCTWWVDRRCAADGWVLEFSRDHGRDAWLWPELLLNGKIAERPEPGCIAVFAPWYYGSVGHVAYVESINENRVTITHANYGIGEIVDTVDGVTIRRAALHARFAPGGRAHFDGHETAYTVTFFKRK